jgi:hypothetical protein
VKAMSINLEKLRAPHSIFIIYMTVSCLIVYLFRYIFPAEPIPLMLFSGEWRKIQGLLALFNLFPALVFSGLVVPFGLGSLEENYPSFSQIFFKRLLNSVIIAICCAGLYALLSFLVLPLAKDQKNNFSIRSELYKQAKEQAQIKSRDGEWTEASQFLNICYQVWPTSPELTVLRQEIEMNLNERFIAQNDERDMTRTALAVDWRYADPTSAEFISNANVRSLSGPQPTTAVEAIALSQAAFRERRYFDAHWLATLGGRIAVRNSPEAANAARLASEAWNMISSQSPTQREERLHELYEKKLSGYMAMNNGEWINAYYIFLDLMYYTPDDPDIANFLKASERAILEYAFFMDEMDLSIGQISSGALFSLPNQRGRAVIRFSNISTSDDVAFGRDFEYMEFNALLRPVINMRAPFVKLLPVTINDRRQIMVITHALSRYDKDTYWKSEWLLGNETMSAVILDISFEDFLLLSQVRRGLPNLQIDELFITANKFGNSGYISEIFQAEVLNRISYVVFFLPMSIIVIVLGWRYRAKKKPRYLFALLLPILPVIFHGFVFLYRSILNTAGIWLVLTIGFSAALTIVIAALALCLLISMIILAAQHG